jgi:hypothetical protein
MQPPQRFSREIKTRSLTIEERQELIELGVIPFIMDDDHPNGRPVTVNDLAHMTKVIAAKDIITGEWHYYE